MKPEFLSRGKRLDNREWVQGSLISFIDGGKMILASKSSVFQPEGSTVFCSDECYQVDPATIGQYTGLTDKNGVKIFKDDIIKSTYNDSVKGPDCGIGQVTFSFGMWYVEGEINNALYDISDCNEIEVIGNIHDNPELLGGGAV